LPGGQERFPEAPATLSADPGADGAGTGAQADRATPADSAALPTNPVAPPAAANAAPAPAVQAADDKAAKRVDEKKDKQRTREARLEGPAPETLTGSDQTAILKLVGPPGLIHRERSAEVWQYAEESCVLLLYFYDKDGTKTLTYFEAMAKTATDPEGVSPAACLSQQIRAFKAKDLG
jgi:hypothetical protein